MKRTTNQEAVATAANVQALDVASMRAMIADDVNRAEVGMFSMLRAGVGLLCCKALSDHGEWEARLLELCPGKSPRTLQGYMAQAREFAESHGITPEQAWPELSKIDATQVSGMMIAAPAQAQLPAAGPNPQAPARRGKKSKAEAAPDPAASAQTFSQMLMDFIQQRKAAKKKKSIEPKPELTKKQRVQTAIDEANRIVNMTADWVADATYTLLPDEELESTMSGLRAAADKVREEFRSRQRKI
jgi:hypothetical protein